MIGHFSEEALRRFSDLAAETQSTNFAEGEIYDFTRCVRPDGTAYGTSGKCRKGVEGAKEIVAKSPKIAKAPKETKKSVSEPKKKESLENLSGGKTVEEHEKAWSDMQKKMMSLHAAGKTAEGNALLPEVLKLRQIWQEAQSAKNEQPDWLKEPAKVSKEDEELQARFDKYNLRQKEAASKLSKDEKKALLDYTHEAKKGPRSYRSINRCLRQNECDGEKSRQVIAELDSAIKKLPNNTDGDTFYRVVRTDNPAGKELYKTLLKAKPGTKFTDPGFSSYSADKSVVDELVDSFRGGAENHIRFVTRSKKLTPINTFSGREYEQEALLPRGTTQTIVSVKKVGNQLLVEID